MKKSYKKYFNATIAAAVVTSGAVVATPTVEAATYPDVQSSDYFYEAVKSLSDRGIIKGFPDGTFKPYQNVTRGQAAKIIAGVLGLDTVNVNNPGFSDVSTSNEYYGAIAALANAGIINGYPDGTFQPNAPVQRNHMAKIIANAFNLQSTSNTTPFTDLHQDYKGYITALYENGITTGQTPTTFGGNANVTRGQLATFVYRAESVKTENKQAEVSLNISDISGNKITAGNDQYEVASALQGLFNEGNKNALKGAVVKAKIVDGQMVSVISLELNAAGKEGALLTLDGNNASIAGDLKVNADFVALKNLKVDGHITLTNKVLKQFNATNVTAKGELIVASLNNEVASLTPIVAETVSLKINLQNVTVLKIRILRDGVQINSNSKLSEMVVSGKVNKMEVNADVENLIINSTEKLTVNGKGSFTKVAVNQSTNLEFNMEGKVDEFVITDPKAKVYIGANVQWIEKIVIPAGVKILDILPNISSNKHKVGKVVDAEGNEINIPSSNSSGSGSSNGKKSNSNEKLQPGQEITKEGTYGPETGILVIDGDLIISAPNVTVRNVIIKGNLIVTAGVGEGKVYLNEVTVGKETIVRGGGDNSIYFIDSDTTKMIVSKKNGTVVRIVAQGDTSVEEVRLETPAIIEEDGVDTDATGFERVIVTESLQSDIITELHGSFDTVISRSRSKNVQIHLSEETVIQTLVLHQYTTVLGSGTIVTADINVYEEEEGEEGEIVVAVEGSKFSKKPNNLMLYSGASVEINGEVINSSYSTHDTTSIESIEAYNGFIFLELENYVAGLTMNDFEITAKLDNQEYLLITGFFNEKYPIIITDRIPIEGNIGKEVEITVTPKSERITGEGKSSKFTINNGFLGTISDFRNVYEPNIEIQFRKGIGTTTGQVVGTAKTNRYGFYSIDLEPGEYTGEIVSPDYLTTYFIVNYDSSEIFGISETAYRKPGLSEAKIMLTWGTVEVLEPETELDVHLIGKDKNNNYYHIYYDNDSEMRDGIMYAELEYDVKSRFGIEAIDIRKLVDGVYIIYAVDYSDYKLSELGAKVAVFGSNSKDPKQTFEHPSIENQEYFWTAGQIVVEDGEIKDVIGTNLDLGNISIKLIGEEGDLYQNEGSDFYDVYVTSDNEIELFASDGATIYYELMDSEKYFEIAGFNYLNIASLNSTKYEGPIPVEKDTILNAIAVQDGVIVGELFAEIYGKYVEFSYGDSYGFTLNSLQIEETSSVEKKDDKSRNQKNQDENNTNDDSANVEPSYQENPSDETPIVENSNQENSIDVTPILEDLEETGTETPTVDDNEDDTDQENTIQATGKVVISGDQITLTITSSESISIAELESITIGEIEYTSADVSFEDGNIVIVIPTDQEIEINSASSITLIYEDENGVSQQMILNNITIKKTE